MSHTPPKQRVNPAEAIAVFSHNLFNEVSCIAGLVHLLDVSQPLGDDEPDFRACLRQLAARSERLVERLQHGLLGLGPQAPDGTNDDAPPSAATLGPS